MTTEEQRAARAADRRLSRYRIAEKEIQSCKRQLVRLRHLARSLPSPKLDASPIVRGEVGDMVASAAVALAEAKADLHSRIRTALLERRMISDSIRRVPDDKTRALLERRYLECMSYEALAEDMGYYDAATVRRAIWTALARYEYIFR